MEGKKDTHINRESIFYLVEEHGEMKPLGKIVKNSVSFKYEEKPYHLQAKNSLSFSVEVSDIPKWFEENLKPMREAQAMLDRLREFHALWHKYYGLGMRKERRKIERDFNALAQRFVLYCKRYGIEIKRKEQ